MKLTLLIGILLFRFASAESAPKAAPPPADASTTESIVEKPEDKYQVSFGLGSPQYFLTFDGGGQSMEFQPNLNTMTALSVSIEGFSIGWDFRNKMEDEKKDLGSTNFDHYWLGYSFKSVRVDAFYGRFKGFYVDSDPNPKKALAPNLTAQTFGATVSWVMSPERFSLRAAIDLGERPKSSGGSWILGTAFVDTSFDNTGEFLDPGMQARVGEDATIRGAHFQTLSFRGGYGYTWKFFEKWMVSGALQAGPGIQKSTIGLLNDSYSQTRLNLNYDMWLSGGWKGDDWYSGLKAIADGHQFPTKSMRISSMILATYLFVGHSF